MTAPTPPFRPSTFFDLTHALVHTHHSTHNLLSAPHTTQPTLHTLKHDLNFPSSPFSVRPSAALQVDNVPLWTPSQLLFKHEQLYFIDKHVRPHPTTHPPPPLPPSPFLPLTPPSPRSSPLTPYPLPPPPLPFSSCSRAPTSTR